MSSLLEDRKLMAAAARHVRGQSAGTRVFFGHPGEGRVEQVMAAGRRVVVLERVKTAGGRQVERVVTPGSFVG